MCAAKCFRIEDQFANYCDDVIVLVLYTSVFTNLLQFIIVIANTLHTQHIGECRFTRGECGTETLHM